MSRKAEHFDLAEKSYVEGRVYIGEILWRETQSTGIYVFGFESVGKYVVDLLYPKDFDWEGYHTQIANLLRSSQPFNYYPTIRIRRYVRVGIETRETSV